MDMNLQTPRTFIRPFRLTDVADLYKVLSNTVVMQYIEPLSPLKNRGVYSRPWALQPTSRLCTGRPN
jgi:hypothetical protein